MDENYMLQIAAGTWEDYPRIKELCELRFGSGYLDETGYARWMEHPDLVQVATIDGDFAGVAVMRPASEEEIAQKMKMDQAEIMDITSGRPAAVYQSIALKHRYEKHGLGRRMVLDGLERGANKGYSAIFIAAWMYDGKIPAQGLLSSLGFTQLYRRELLWYGEKNYQCVACGGRCVCDGMIYYKKLGG